MTRQDIENSTALLRHTNPMRTQGYAGIYTNTSDPLARHYQQQATVGKNKPDPNGGRSVEMGRSHIKESIQLRHKAILYLESSGPKKERKTKKTHNTEKWRQI
ncbi:unnamed protein product [Schistosoma curassoni]|uniref:Integrase n=1 Tax=Schistosoma curassoni TaxID=6186 RepID=A0A183JBG9_9TREM|nr:unnamed protein product [Schistosoma curassoni]